MRVRLMLGALSNGHFDNALVPLRTPHVEYLPRYATRFDALELDELYHRVDLDERILLWADQAPKGFRFPAKLSKNACNPKDRLDADLPWDDAALDAARVSLETMAPLRAHGVLGPVVVQFPARFQCTKQHVAWLDELLDLERPGTFVVEFRHDSWFVPQTESFLRERATQLVWGTTKTAFAPPWVTGPVGYVRFVGPHHKSKTRNRAVHVEDRVEDLLRMRDMLAAAPWKECFVAVLNPFEGNALDSLPGVAAALEGPERGRRLSRRPGEPLLKDPPGGPKQTGLTAF